MRSIDLQEHEYSFNFSEFTELVMEEKIRQSAELSVIIECEEDSHQDGQENDQDRSIDDNIDEGIYQNTHNRTTVINQ